MLKFLLDENVRVEVKEFLESEGFKVGCAPKGIANSKIASLAKEEKAVLLSHDMHFSDTLLYRPEEFAGIVVIKIPPSMLKEIISALGNLLKKVKNFSGKLIFIELSKFKIVEGPFRINP